ncbi:MAG: hypothetical protein KDA24_14930 [Deltaproteobacteria bacterium]|nr:hypothetical protein [Deltaproteobacteria bacterium]
MAKPSRLPVVHELLGRVYTDTEWEALCNRCGACCYESRWTDTGWEDTGVPCEYLDAESKLCGAYGKRFDVEPDCIRVTASVVLSGILPPECSYHDELARITEEDQEIYERREQRKGGRRRTPR